MAVFDIGDWTVFPAVRGSGDRWVGMYSITTRHGIEPEHRYPVTDVPGTFPTEEAAMEAAIEAGRFIAQGFADQGNVEPYRDFDPV